MANPDLEDIIRRMRITKLEAKLALREIEREDLNRALVSGRATLNERADVIARRDELQGECAAIEIELKFVRGSTAPI